MKLLAKYVLDPKGRIRYIATFIKLKSIAQRLKEIPTYKVKIAKLRFDWLEVCNFCRSNGATERNKVIKD